MNKENTPIIVANSNWDLPESLIRDVNQERMINSLVGIAKSLSPEESVGWAECVAYLMPASLTKPLSSDVAKIYLYCATQLQKIKGKFKALPKDCIVEELTDYEMQKLNELKRWIYKKRGGKEKNPVVNAFNEVFKEANCKKQKKKGGKRDSSHD